jgi:hypothetical protein
VSCHYSIHRRFIGIQPFRYDSFDQISIREDANRLARVIQHYQRTDTSLMHAFGGLPNAFIRMG